MITNLFSWLIEHIPTNRKHSHAGHQRQSMPRCVRNVLTTLVVIWCLTTYSFLSTQSVSKALKREEASLFSPNTGSPSQEWVNGNNGNEEKAFNMESAVYIPVDSEIQKRLQPNSTDVAELIGYEKTIHSKGFAACLLIMDDNHYLVEWLAYHYTFLPLRRLIVALDPKSKTSPMSLLARYSELIKTTIWLDADFFKWQNRRIRKASVVKAYLARQEYFYQACLQQLKLENYTWVAVIDTDEFVTPNWNADFPHRIRSTTQDEFMNQTNITFMDLVTSPANQHLNDKTNTSCIPMQRLQMSVQDWNTTSDTGDAWNLSLFMTYRYRHTQHPHAKGKQPLASKSIVDVSSIPWTEFRDGNHNPHRPVKTVCPKRYAAQRNGDSPYVVHHYVGSWEQFSFRQDSRQTRTMERYQRLNYTRQYYNHHATFWLPQFAKQVGGVKRARELLNGIGSVIF